ncbi:MAG: hydrogenase [Bacillota bacterium]|nr:hydrogenase [Bacillota bacterium]
MEFLIAFILISALAMSGLRRIKLLNNAFAAQSLLISALCMAKGLQTGEYHYYILFILTLGIKVLGIPYIVNRSIRQIKLNRETELIINGFWSYIFTGFSVAVIFVVLRNYGDSIFRTGIALMISGSILLIGRKKAITQMLGLLTLENGIVLFEVAMIKMGWIIEFGILFELLVLALIMGMMIFRINKTFDTVNTDYLTSLKE